jgi:DNA-binding transcriptional LysR family regulator
LGVLLILHATARKIALLQVNLPLYSAKMQELDWNDLRYVLVLSRTRRLARAAHQLRVNETTIARRVARIEKVLGSRLFERVNGALLVTDIGQVVVRRAEQIEVDVGEVKNAATGADTRAAGSVRLKAIPVVLNRVLVPRSRRCSPPIRYCNCNSSPTRGISA